MPAGNNAACSASGGQDVLGANADSLKQAARDDLEEKEYNVEDFYYEKGWAQAVAKNEYFGHLTLGVISFNAVWIGVDSDHNGAPTIDKADMIFQVMEQVFCVFFTFEWLVRFLAFRKKRDGLKDGWFKFDSVLVGMMVMETWMIPIIMGGAGGGSGMGDASMLRLLRLLRLTRMARLMRSVPELLVLLKGMVAAARSVFSTLVLLILFTYVFAIIFKQQTGEIDDLDEFFHSIPEAMWNLLLAGTLLDNITDRLNLLREKTPVMCGVFLFWVLLSSFTILNMLIGVLCEVVAAVAEAEKEQGIVKFVKKSLRDVLEQFDKDASGAISEAEFEAFVDDDQVTEPLEELGVDRDNLKALKDVIFSKNEEKKERNTLCESPEEGSPNVRKSILAQQTFIDQQPRELSFGEILEMILNLRSENPAMVKDIVDLRKHLRSNHQEVDEMFRDLAAENEEVRGTQKELSDVLANLAKRQEEMVTNMIAPLADGVKEIQERLRKADVAEADVSAPVVKSQRSMKNGELPPLVSPAGGTPLGAPRIPGQGPPPTPSQKEKPRVRPVHATPPVSPRKSGVEVEKEIENLSDAGTDESV